MVDLIDRNTMIARYLASREKAMVSRGGQPDWGVVKEIDFQLSRLGYRPEQPASAARAEATADAEAVPAGRGTTRRAREPGTLAPLD